MQVFSIGSLMKEFYYLQFVTHELEAVINDLTGKSNIFVKEVHIEPGKSVIKYEILTIEGFQQKELSFFNNIKV